MASLSILFPSPKKVDVDGKAVTIKPVTLEHFDLYGRVAGQLIELLSGASVQQINRYAEKHSKDVNDLLAVTTDMSWLARKRLPGVAAVQLLVAVVMENAGFFGEALPGMIDALNGAMSSSD